MPGNLARRVNEEHRACVEASGKAVWHAVSCGEFLIKARDGSDFGKWLDWLAANFEASRSTAYNYINLAENRKLLVEADSQRVGNLSLRDALALLVPDRAESDSLEGGSGEAPTAAKKPSRRAGKPRHNPGGSPDRKEPKTELVIYRADDLPALPDDLETVLGDGRAVALTCDVAASEPSADGELEEAESFLRATVRAVRAKLCDAHLLVICSSDPAIRDTAERALAGCGEASEAEREKYEAQVLREAEKAEDSLHWVILQYGGIRPHQDGDLGEEYKQVPLDYRRVDGLTLDEMADQLATHHSHLGVQDERDLLRELAKRRKWAA